MKPGPFGDAPEPLTIDPDVRRAANLPPGFYRDPILFARARERLFARSWQLVGDAERLKTPGQLLPLCLLEGCLSEPLLLTRDADDRLHCLSNVCTHRGNLLCEGEGRAQTLRCRYHGRRFALDGRFLSMPEFEEALEFPRPADDLPRLPLGRWGRFLFASLDPAFPLADLLAPVEARLGWLPLSSLRLDPGRSRDYRVEASWALYCDNFLEGFHIPYVHPALAGAIDYGAYRTELHRFGSLQLAPGKNGADAFDLPPGSPDHGQPIAAYYFFLFPNLMLNFYPWGLSINVVTPLAPDRTRVSFFAYVLDESRLATGPGAALDRVEREDEAVVESVQRGIRSRLYRRGRYSPSRETAVHHFHRLIAEFLA